MSNSRTTVGEMLDKLQQYPRDMIVEVRFAGGGSVVVERRDVTNWDKSQTDEVVGIFNSNGGQFGYAPLTEDEYQKKSREFLSGLFDRYRLKAGYGRGVQRYTSIFGDHRIYFDYGGSQDGCYGEVFDHRIVKRLLDEGYIEKKGSGIDRDGVMLTNKGIEVFLDEKNVCRYSIMWQSGNRAGV